MSLSLSGNKNFWIAQLIGWAIFGVTNMAVQIILNMPFTLVFFNTFLAIIAGVITTTIYRSIVRRIAWANWRIWSLLFFISCATLILAIGWMGLIVLLFNCFVPESPISFNELIGNLINGSLLFLIWNLIYFFFHYFSKYQSAELERWRFKAEAREAQLGTLKAQINPHFVFNALNNILALILENPDKARTMLLHFSNLFRYSLQHSDQQGVRVADEVEMIEQYLDLLSIQYEERLKYTVVAAADVLEERIPPMMLQFLVENAIKHGIALERRGGELKVHLYREAQQVYMEVKNTGNLSRQADVESRLGVGLKNIRERLLLLYKGRANLTLEEVAPFVIARIQIPTAV